MGNIRLSALQKDLFRLTGRLNGNGLAVQVIHGVNIAFCIDGDDLPADHVGAGPLVILLTPIHGETAPNTVDLPIVHERPFLLPVDGCEHRLIAHPPERLVRDLDVDARRIAVFIHIHERRVGVASDGDLGQCFGLRCRHSALTPRQRRTEQPQRQQHRGHSFHPVLLKFNGVRPHKLKL